LSWQQGTSLREAFDIHVLVTDGRIPMGCLFYNEKRKAQVAPRNNQYKKKDSLATFFIFFLFLQSRHLKDKKP